MFITPTWLLRVMVSQTEFDDLKSMVSRLIKQKEDDDETIRKLAHKPLEHEPLTLVRNFTNTHNLKTLDPAGIETATSQFPVDCATIMP